MIRTSAQRIAKAREFPSVPLRRMLSVEAGIDAQAVAQAWRFKRPFPGPFEARLVWNPAKFNFETRRALRAGQLRDWLQARLMRQDAAHLENENET